MARGGKPICNLPDSRTERFRWAGVQADKVNHGFALSRGRRRRVGQIINPVTGETVEKCLTINRLAGELGTPTAKLTTLLESLGWVDRILAWKQVPMISYPGLAKPQYYHTPSIGRAAVANNLMIPVKTYRNGAIVEMMLVTPKGRALVERKLAGITVSMSDARPRRKVDTRRAAIADLLRQGHTQAEIVRRTSLPKQTVSRHVRALRRTA